MGPMDLGSLKQKAPDLKWWVPGVHQILLWIGIARAGRTAKKNDAENRMLLPLLPLFLLLLLRRPVPSVVR